MSEKELIAALEATKSRLSRATRALAPKHKGGEMEEFQAAREAMYTAERALAAARNEAHAVPLEFPVQWDVGAPLPHLISNDLQTFLIFLLPDRPPDLNGLAIVEFERCVSAKMGAPNDEVYSGHPLYGKGLEGYRPLQVIHSPWIRELEAINAVHPGYDRTRWQGLTHYFLGFHDCTFECVARSFIVETGHGAISDALATVCRRLML